MACPCLRTISGEGCSLFKYKSSNQKIKSKFLKSNLGQTTRTGKNLKEEKIFIKNLKQNREDECITQEMSTRVTEVVTTSLENGDEAGLQTL